MDVVPARWYVLTSRCPPFVRGELTSLRSLEMLSEHIPTADRIQTIRDGLFFIVGPHRAGTTLVQAMLSSHSALTIPPETGFFDQVWTRRQTLGSLATPDGLIRVGRFVNGPDCSVSDLGLEWPAVAQALSGTRGGYDDLFAALLTLYADHRGKRRVGEKSPRHLFAATDIVQLYPHAKFLCLIRDPRAVARSERETSWGSKSVCRITRRWCRVVDEAARLQRLWSAERFRVIRYEDLVSEPERTLRAICDFLGETFEPQMLQFHERPIGERGFRADEEWKQNTLRALDASRSQQWRTGLSPAQIKLIENLAGPRLGQEGYALDEASVGTPAFASAWLSDHLLWALELVTGVLKGRTRRRPWSSVWREVWTR